MTKFQFILLLIIFNLLLFVFCCAFVIYVLQFNLIGSKVGIMFLIPILSLIGSAFLIDQKIGEMR